MRGEGYTVISHYLIDISAWKPQLNTSKIEISINQKAAIPSN